MKCGTCIRLALVFVSVLGIQYAQVAAGGGLAERAQAYVRLLADEKFGEAAGYFDERMKSALPGAKLGEIWKAQGGVLGRLEAIEGTRAEPADGYEIIYVTCRFKNQRLDIKLAFDKGQKIAGMFFVPTKPD